MSASLLPRIEDVNVMVAIARLQKQESFEVFKKWLLTEGKDHLIKQMVSKPGNNTGECFAYQFVEALEELFSNSKGYAEKMLISSGKPKTSLSMEDVKWEG